MTWNIGLEPGTPAYTFASGNATIMRVLAGPGTGKSFALRRRIARLIEQGASPERILAVTFTRTAASDLRREISSLEVNGADRVVAKTLHSLCFSILGRREILDDTGRVPRPLLAHEIKPMLHDLSNHVFGSIRDKEKKIKAFEAAWARLQHEEAGYALFQDDHQFEIDLINWLRDHEAMLIGELIPQTLRYIQDNPLSPDANQFDHVLVDEYQDLNKAEQELVLLLKGAGTLAVIGDDDQSIYSFKHAHPEGIREFQERNQGCESIEFAECRRCPTSVVNMAASLIANNENRTLGPLLPATNNDTGDVSILQWPTLDEEVTGIVEIISHHLSSDSIEPQDILILTPRRRIGYKIRNCLIERGINTKSYFREEALDSDISRIAFSLLNLFAYPNDKVALRFLLGQGSGDYRSGAYDRVKQRAEVDCCSIRDVLDKLMSGELRIAHTANIIDSYTSIIDKMDDIRNILQDNPNGIINYLAPYDNEEFEGLRSALEAAFQAVGEFQNNEEQNIETWIVSLFEETRDNISMPSVPDNVDHVRIMSLHASKGLSSKFVVITSCIDELLPGNIDLEQDRRRYEEEQRRLFYVAITRCKNEAGIYPGKLFLSSVVGIQGREALQMGIHARNVGETRRVRASRFLSQLGANRPRTLVGSTYLERL